MRWDYLFTRSMLQRGINYYFQDRVSNISIVESDQCIHFKADVKGSRKYVVSGAIQGKYVTHIDCTCPYAEDGSHCKHMAAVLYSIEAREQEKQQEIGKAEQIKRTKRKRITPFSRSTSGAYQYFDFGKITEELMIYDLDYQAAEKWIANGDDELQLEFGFDGHGLYKSMIGKSSYGPAELVFSRDEILRMRCNHYHCSCFPRGYQQVGRKMVPCIHMLALFIQIQGYLNEHEVGDSTDLDALQLLQAFRQTRAIQKTVSAPEVGVVRLKPRLIQSYGGFCLAFRIGREKLYMVKNMTTLVSTVEERGSLPLGKQQELYFAQDSFDAQSERYFRLIQQWVNEAAHWSDREIQHNYHAVPVYDAKSDFDLYGARLDDFFDAAEGEESEFINKLLPDAKVTPLHMQQSSPEIALTIRKDMDQHGTFHGVIIEGNLPEFIHGAHYQYFLSTDDHGAYLNRIAPEKSKKLEPLYMLQASGQISLRVGRQKLSEFYYSALPILRQCATIHEQNADVIRSYLPPEAAFIFYLDAVDRKPTCRIAVQYGSASCSVFDWLREDFHKESFRDEIHEKEAIDVVQNYFPELDTEQQLFHCGEDEDAIYHILESGVSTLMEYGEVHSTNRFLSLRIRRTVKIQVGVSMESDLMNLEIGSTDISREELLEVLQSYQLKRNYHRLRNGDFLNLDENIAELSAMVDAMHLTPKAFIQGNMQIPAYRALYLDKMLEQCEGLYAHRDQNFRKLIKEFKTVNDSDFEVPESLQNTMRNYQIYGHKWLRTVESNGFGGILADDMGLGKTLQMISVLLAAKEEGRTGCSLIVCPSSLVYNWLEEFRRFAPQLSVCVVAGTKEARHEMINHYQQWDVLVTSYDLLKRDVAYYEDAQFEYQVLDEAQYIKTHTTSAAKSVKIIRSKRRFALTGTPIENRLSELWSIFDYLMPGYLYGYDTFKKELEAPIVKKSDEEAKKRLRRMVAPFILRRLKSDVLKDLPDKIEEVRYARFSTHQQQIYDGQVLRMKEMLESQNEEELRKNKIQILAELTRIRQICCDPSLLFEDYHGESAKRGACMELIQSAIEGEHRVLLFSQFTSMLDLLEQDLQNEKISYYKITGTTAKKERMELVNRFNADETSVFLISLKAGGTGLNLTGADVVIHYDPWWNVAAQNQATDRAHRIGQTKVVSVYQLIVKDSIEEKIRQMQQNKQDLANEILSGELGGIGSMSKEDLLQLLQ